MALPVYLRQFKAAGIYRVVFDKSTVLGTYSETLRLVVGYSEKGPFNTPTYVASSSDFVNIFGGISKKLEKRGIFFHRLAIQALQSGPILALNLKKFSTETVGAVSFLGVGYNENDECELISKGMTTEPVHIKVSDIYDTTRFWSLDANKLQESDIKRYEVYKEGEEGYKLPYQAKNDGVSDDDFANNNGDTFESGYIKVCQTGESGNTLFIRPAFGRQVAQYNITVKDYYANIGEEMPEFFEGYEQTKMSEYFAEVYVFKGEFNADQVLASQDLQKYFITTDDGIKLRKSIKNAHEDNVDSLDSLYREESAGAIGHYVGCLVPYFKDAQGVYSSLDYVFNMDIDSHNMMMSFNDDLLNSGDCKANIINLSGIDNFTTDTIKFINDIYNESATVSTLYNDNVTVTRNVINVDIKDEENGESALVVKNSSLTANVNDESVSFCQIYQQVIDGIDFEGNDIEIPEDLKTANGKRIIVANDSLANIFSQGDTIIDDEGNVCYIQSVGTFEYEVDDVQMSSAKGDYLVRVNDILTNEIGTVQPIYLHGYTYANSRPKSLKMLDKLNWQKQILSTLTDYKGLKTGLLSKADVDYRYIVDTFESFVDSECKSTLSLLAQQKESCFAICNFPSAKSFVKCPYTSFTNNEGVFNVEYIVNGSNKKKASSCKFSLPQQINGASYCAFYTPLKFSDGYVDTIVPSAALVSNLFMEKYKSRHPYDIVAGPNYASITYPNLVGPDYNYSPDELQIIEPFGVNCLVYRQGFGTFINANQTAKQTPVSALSKVNVRELVIFIQDEIEKVLQSYQWEFNNPVTRGAILDKANQICEVAKSNGGILDYINIMDTSNNTNDVIDNEMAIISTHIEAGRGCGKMVQTLTVYRTGQMRVSISE